MTAITERFDLGQERERLGGVGMPNESASAAPARQRRVPTRVADPEPAVPRPSHPLVATGGRTRRVERAGHGVGPGPGSRPDHDGDVRARPRRAAAPGVEAATPAPAAPAAATPTRDERLRRPGHAIVRHGS